MVGVIYTAELPFEKRTFSPFLRSSGRDFWFASSGFHDGSSLGRDSKVMTELIVFGWVEEHSRSGVQRSCW